MAPTRRIPRRLWHRLATAAALALMLAALLGLRAQLASAGDPVRALAADARRGADDAGGQVEIEDFAYRPRTLTVAPGTRVVFANRDEVAHTVTRKGGFNSGRIRPGRSFAVRFNHTGTFRFHCTIHPFMRGKVVVR